MKRYKYTDDELLNLIVHKAKELGRIPKSTEMSNPSACVYRDRFGSWNNAVKKANLQGFYDYRRLSNGRIIKLIPQYLSEESILEIFKKEIEKFKNDDYNIRAFDKKTTTFNSMQFMNRLNMKWNELLEYSGMTLNHVRSYKEEELLNELKKLIEKLDYVPTKPQLIEMKFPWHILDHKKYTYAQALEKIGYSNINKTPECVKESDEELLKMYIDFSNKIGKGSVGASVYDLNNSKDIYNADVFLTRFGGMTGLRKSAGFKVKKHKNKKYSNEDIEIILLEEYKRKGRRLSYTEIKNNKNIPGITTILRYFKVTNLSKLWDNILNKEN